MLAEYLRLKMRQKGLTAKEVEARSGGGITDSYISKLKRGHTKKPSIPKLKALAKGLGVDEGEVFEAAGVKLIQTEVISAHTLVHLMQMLIDNSDLATVTQILAKQRPAKIKAILKSLESEKS
jgi:transcriptional regulator with XRE-family HTH domain